MKMVPRGQSALLLYFLEARAQMGKLTVDDALPASE